MQAPEVPSASSLLPFSCSLRSTIYARQISIGVNRCRKSGCDCCERVGCNDSVIDSFLSSGETGVVDSQAQDVTSRVVRWNTIGDKPLPDVVFKTVFIRPSKLRFSFTSQWGNSKVFSDESITFTSHQFRDALERNVSIREALNGVSGITMGAAKEVPTLLIPALRDEQIGFRSLIQTLKNVELSTSQQIDGEDCHCLVSSYDLAATSSISLWVSKVRSHLKQIQEISFFPPDTEHVLGEHWSTLISYKALRFNEDIDLQELERGD